MNIEDKAESEPNWAELARKLLRDANVRQTSLMYPLEPASVSTLDYKY